MNAVILAGGFGSRLKPLTDEIIKPMLPLANVPMIDYSVSHLSSFGIKDYIFTLCHKPEQVISWAIGYHDLTTHFSFETTPLGTLGGIKSAQSFLDDTFIVVSGDALEDINFDAMLHKHISSNADITMAVKTTSDPSLYGVVEFDAWGTVTGFVEKPKNYDAHTSYINCGVYIMEKRLLAKVPSGIKYDFARDLFPSILNSGKISAYIHDGYWCDIGDVNSYFKANFDVLEGGFFPNAYNFARVNYLSYQAGTANKSLISSSSRVLGNISSSIIGNDVRILSNAYLENCIVFDGATIKGQYSNCIIGKDFNVSPSLSALSYPNRQNSHYTINNFS